jgi:archaellum component FlaC
MALKSLLEQQSVDINEIEQQINRVKTAVNDIKKELNRLKRSR